jgi:hypothetical protein
MKLQQWQYFAKQWKPDFATEEFDREQAQLVLVFGDPALVTDKSLFTHIQQLFPAASIVSSSTAGEIINNEVYDGSIVVTAMQFEKTTTKCFVTNIHKHTNSYEAGKHLMQQLMAHDLQAVFVLSDGTNINGSELVAGLNENNTHHISVTGGLAGDGARFIKTFVGLNQVPEENLVVAVGFYGNSLKIGHGSFGGWDEFGPERTITRSDKNVLFEIDGKNALDLYKEYLGPYKNELPGSALLFPLSLKEPDSDQYLVRTILGINDEAKSMHFAGNLPQGSKVRLMKANFDKLIEGSSIAAKNSFTTLSNSNPELAILISCVGRKLILQERTDEEVDAVKKIFAGKTAMTGFYSYGEISPLNQLTRCELHNQTMTITTISES